MNFVCDKCSYNILQPFDIEWVAFGMGTKRRKAKQDDDGGAGAADACAHRGKSSVKWDRLSIPSSFLIDDVEGGFLLEFGVSCCTNAKLTID